MYGVSPLKPAADNYLEAEESLRKLREEWLRSFALPPRLVIGAEQTNYSSCRDLILYRGGKANG